MGSRLAEVRQRPRSRLRLRLSFWSVERLAQHGIAVPSDAVDGAGRTHPRLSTLPMGFLAAPAIAQGAHESVIYGSEGGGSADARALAPALSPAARLSSRNQPKLDSPASREPQPC